MSAKQCYFVSPESQVVMMVCILSVQLLILNSNITHHLKITKKLTVIAGRNICD